MTDPSAPRLTRRALLARGAALAALPLATSRALGQQTSDVDVIIIGAGAAGIAAARRIAEAGRTYALIEASNRVGGRAVTDTAIFGVPFDLGATRLNMPAARPMAAYGRAEGLDITRAPEARLYVKGREAGDADYEAFVATVRRAERAIVAAGDAGRDMPAARALPELGPWGASARFVVGPLGCAKELEEVSSVDLARADEREGEDVCRQGVGTLVAQLARTLTVRLETVARSVDLSGRLVSVQTSKGTLQGRSVILAIPPSIIAAGKLRIGPTLAPRYRTACEKITLGAYDHIAFQLPRNPIGLGADELVYFRSEGPAPYALRARAGGSDLYMLEVAGTAAAKLAEAPPDAATAFLKEVLAREFGAGIAARVGKVYATRWSKEPWALGAFSCALPGYGNMRRAFVETVAGRMFFAGEHAHETLWGTVGGAWLSGERAARQALGVLGVRAG